MLKQKKRKKKFNVHKFIYRNRTNTIEQLIWNPSLIILESGFHLHHDPETYDLKKIARVQKNLRQKLHTFLTENGYPNDSYILNVDAPVRAAGKTVFISMLLTVPQIETSLAANEAFCCHWIDELHAEFNFLSNGE